MIIESKLKEFAEHRVADAITSKDDTDSVAIVVDGQRNPDSTGFVFDARAIEACDVYILYLISRNKINEASDVAIGSRLKGYISPDVSELLTANAAFTHVITRDFCAILPSESKKTTAEQVLAVGYVLCKLFYKFLNDNRFYLM